jgi:hypothetical protein
MSNRRFLSDVAEAAKNRPADLRSTKLRDFSTAARGKA